MESVYFSREGGSLVFRNHGETLLITPWNRDTLRVRSVMMSEISDERWALLDRDDTEAEIRIGENEASITCGSLTATVTVEGWHERGRIVFTNSEGRVLLRERGSEGAIAAYARHFQPALGGDYRLTVSFCAQEGEHLYGMGQYQQEELDLKYMTLELAQRNSQASVPFYMSSLGYGFLWHNPAVGQATFGKNYMVWQAQSTRQMDYVVFSGETPAQISLAYARATGFAPMMPDSLTGLWQCKLRYWNQEQVLEVAREYKRRGLPLDVMVVDFFHWPKMGDYRFDPEFFPDPERMCAELRDMGVTCMVSVWPQVSHESENYHDMRRKNLLVRSEYGEQIGMRFGGDSMFFDATNPRARDYVWALCKRNYWDRGVRMFWLDEAEPEYGTYDYSNYRYHSGTVLQTGNAYPQAFARCFYDGMRAEGVDNPVNLLRCAWAGSQRYGALVWSGDIFSSWECFRMQVCAGLNMGIAGIPWWTTDIGGFHGGRIDDDGFRELLIRWFQWGAYCPVMRLHGDRQPFEAVTARDGTPREHTGAPNELWSFGDTAYEILKKYLLVREALRPYTHEVMAEAHEAGKPVMRPMFYEFPGDEVCYTLKDQYLYGSRYLVAPVLHPGERERRVYLPKGAWRNVDTGKILTGTGDWAVVPAPLDVMPVLERLG
ncbi:MAG: glycoside hydrolase family 31 protein [bacterium]|nr:glycoside hydrolase family 31 protein [bacterium]